MRCDRGCLARKGRAVACDGGVSAGRAGRVACSGAVSAGGACGCRSAEGKFGCGAGGVAGDRGWFEHPDSKFSRPKAKAEGPTSLRKATAWQALNVERRARKVAVANGKSRPFSNYDTL